MPVFFKKYPEAFPGKSLYRKSFLKNFGMI
jgi:hypothetical protein